MTSTVDADRVRASLKRARARADEAMAEVRRLFAIFIKRGPPLKKIKSGRPSIWFGLEGYLLVRTVEEIRAEERYSITVAIKRAINKEHILKDCAAIRRLSDQTLQIRYQRAADYWSITRREALRKELKRANEIAREAIESVRVLRRLLDTLEGRPVSDPEDYPEDRRLFDSIGYRDQDEDFL
jgi:hypothetical protein